MPVTSDHPVGDPEAARTHNDSSPANPLRELMAFTELSAWPAAGAFAAFMAENGSPRPVLVLPGFISGDTATLPLRAFLRSVGHHPRGWKLGINVGAANHVATGVDRVLRDMAEEWGCPIDIVGWSAGGIFGRILAHNRTEEVRQVISLGSPIKADLHRTSVRGMYNLMARFFVGTPRHVDVDSVPVPSTTVWTKTDGIVPGHACRQTPNETAEVVEVRGSHCGLGVNMSVYYLIADRLAQPEGQWAPFSPPPVLKWLYPSLEGG